MRIWQSLGLWLAGGYRGVSEDRDDRDRDDRDRDARDRGDVPGWVMVTVMSAILVVAILAVFEPQIKDAITNAIDSVSNSK